MKTKTCSKATSVIAIAISCIMAVVCCFCFLPHFIKGENVTQVGNMYPDYSFDELVEHSDAIEYCTLTEVKAPQYTVNDIGRMIITTDYIFTSKETNDDITVRLIGGSIGETTVVNEDDAYTYFLVGEDYVLFLNRYEEGIESEYHTLVTGKSSVLIFNNTDSVNSVDEKYNVSYSELQDLFMTK